MQYLAGDQQGTASIAIDSATLDVTRRYYDPFGKQIGTAPASWPGEQGFVGGTTDATTGLVNLGAREYNPATGTFISPDPLLDPTVPQDLNAFTYAGDNPTTNSDPTGANYIVGLPNGGECTGSLQYCGSLYNKESGGSGTNRSSNSGSASGNTGISGTTSHAENPPYTDAPAPPNGDGSHAASHKTTNGSTGGGGYCPSGVATRFFTLSPACIRANGPSSTGGGGHAKWWIFGGLGVLAVALTVINILQAGADPVTDGAEAADIGEAADVASSGDGMASSGNASSIDGPESTGRVTFRNGQAVDSEGNISSDYPWNLNGTGTSGRATGTELEFPSNEAGETIENAGKLVHAVESNLGLPASALTGAGVGIAITGVALAIAIRRLFGG